MNLNFNHFYMIFHFASSNAIFLYINKFKFILRSKVFFCIILLLWAWELIGVLPEKLELFRFVVRYFLPIITYKPTYFIFHITLMVY